MYKVLIADDEVKVCRLIKNIIDWKSFDIEVVGLAYDGIEALQIIEQENPDIVITDIKMPGYDGIELIKRAKELVPEICFVIISGYRDFDYAHHAIKFGVEDYLLKPLKEEELFEIIAKIVQKKQSYQEKQKSQVYMQQRIAVDTKKIQHNFIECLVKNSKNLPNILEREKVNQEYHCNFQEGIFQILIIKPDISNKRENKEAYQILINKVQKIAEKELREGTKEILSTISEEGVYFLINADESYEKEIRKKLKHIQKSICSLRDLFWEIQATVGLGIKTTYFSELRESMESAKRAILNRIFMGTGHVIGTYTLQKSSVSVKDIIDNSIRINLLERIEILDKEEIKKIMQQLEKTVQEKEDIDGEVVLEMSNYLVDIFIFGLKNINSKVKEEKIKTEFIQQFHLCTCVREVFLQLERLFERELQKIIEQKEKTETKPIRIAKKYIQDNFYLPLKLEEVSHMVGFNSTYFSSLFKKETGKNFSEYLIQIRINKAKQLLSQEDINIIEVAEQVGYSDLKHFSKLFKKVTGLNPSEFRKLYHRL